MATAHEPRPRIVITSKAFQRDVKRLRKRGKELEQLRAIVESIRLGAPLQPRHRDHPLAGEWKGFRDCHVESDWLLVYRLDDEAVYLTRTGTHSDLFG